MNHNVYVVLQELIYWKHITISTLFVSGIVNEVRIVCKWVLLSNNNYLEL